MNEQTTNNPPASVPDAGAPAAPAAENTAPLGMSGSGTPGVATPDDMREAMKEIFDPEIPINIVDLGLIYGIHEKDGNVDITMTLTSPHCPVADQLKARVNEVLGKLPGIKQIKVEISHSPPWSKEKLSFEGKLQASMLGIM
jgi:metal-sulfur cluster biosynthetic enzyme